MPDRPDLPAATRRWPVTLNAMPDDRELAWRRWRRKPIMFAACPPAA